MQPTIVMRFAREIVIGLTSGADFAAFAISPGRVAASGGAPVGKDVWVLWDGGIRAAPRVSTSRGTSRRVGGLVPPSIHAFAKSLQVQSQSPSTPPLAVGELPHGGSHAHSFQGDRRRRVRG